MPCPFCGGTLVRKKVGVRTYRFIYDLEGNEYRILKCSKCGKQFFIEGDKDG